jgi:hypothetical protein
MPPAWAAMTPREILARADQARGNAAGVQWRIAIEAIENGRKHAQTLQVKAQSFNVLAETLDPPRAKGRLLLMIDRNMWFVQPGLRKPVPISPRQRLLGGAANGDIAATDYAGNYEVVQMSDAVLDGDPCYLFDLKAHHDKGTYDRIKYWIAKGRLVGVRAEFFTVSGIMLKSATFAYDNSIQIRDTPQPFISHMIITDAVVKDNITTMTYSHAKVEKIPDTAFNLNLLMK